MEGKVRGVPKDGRNKSAVVMTDGSQEQSSKKKSDDAKEQNMCH